MRDLPLFTTEYGIASLTLREIPYTQRAYIQIQQTEHPAKLLQECLVLCCAAGAEHIYISGHGYCEKYPFHTSILQMQREKSLLPETDVALFPVTEQTVERWRELYNEKATRIPNGAWMDKSGARQMLLEGSGYFVHNNGVLLGIGQVSGNTVSWLCAVRPGAGREVLCALSQIIPGDTVILEVASANKKAVEFYQKMGFIPTGELSRWYVLKE